MPKLSNKNKQRERATTSEFNSEFFIRKYGKLFFIWFLQQNDIDAQAIQLLIDMDLI